MRLPPTPRPPKLSRASAIGLFYTGLTLIAVAWGAARGHPAVYRLGDRLEPSRTAINIAAGIGFGLLMVLMTRYAVHRFEWARALHQEFRHLLGPLRGREIFILALASAVGEECFFRGAMMPHLGLVATSVLFGLLHIGPGRRFVPWTIESFLVGLALGAMARWGGDLGGPIAAHFTINFLNLRFIVDRDLG